MARKGQSQHQTHPGVGGMTEGTLEWELRSRPPPPLTCLVTLRKHLPPRRPQVSHKTVIIAKLITTFIKCYVLITAL